jgi:hypothetical protein
MWPTVGRTSRSCGSGSIGSVKGGGLSSERLFCVF